MFDPTKISEEMVKFLRTSWETYLKILETVQSQTEKALELILTQSDALREEGKQLIKSWLDLMKQSQEQYKKMMEENLSKLEEIMSKGKE